MASHEVCKYVERTLDDVSRIDIIRWFLQLNNLVWYWESYYPDRGNPGYPCYKMWMISYGILMMSEISMGVWIWMNYTVWSFSIAMENDHLYWIFPWKIVIFHSYVKLPECNDLASWCHWNDGHWIRRLIRKCSYFSYGQAFVVMVFRCEKK